MFDIRINRMSFWVLATPIMLLMTGANLLGFRITGMTLVLAMVCVFRLHDLGRTGKWVLGPVALEFVAALIAISYLPTHLLPVAGFAINGAILLGLMWLGSEAGERVSNPWGGPPPPGFAFGKRSA